MKRKFTGLEKFFGFHEHRTSLKIELSAGLTTFLTAAYIIFVHPDILSQTGMDRGALITVTCVASGIATLLMALWARAPLMLAPGMGLNAYFTFGVCIANGVPWNQALGIVFVSGLLFFLLAVAGVRGKVIHAIPQGLRKSIAVGIGFFIAFIGLQNLGLVARSDATLVKLGQLTPQASLGFIGFLLMAVLELRKIPGSILIGILVISGFGMTFGLSPTPERFVSLPNSMAPVFAELDLTVILKVSLWPLIFTFMYVDLFDSIGTFLAVSRRAGLVRPDGSIKGIHRLLKIDCLSTMFGAILGTSTVTAYVESAAGISQGGRTGLTALTTAILFFLAMFFWPVITAVPAYATAPALIFVGVHMIREIQEIRFQKLEVGIPAFLVILLMPLTYSISNGIMFGFLVHAVIQVSIGRWKKIGMIEWIIVVFSILQFLVMQVE